MKLDVMVAQAIVWARTIETMLHSSGPWLFRTSAGFTPALRILDQDRSEIIFMGLAKPSPDGVVELWTGDQMVTMATTDFTQGNNKITWRLSLKRPLQVS